MTLTPAQEDEIFVEEVLQRINEHDPSVPFFLFWAPHIVHAPLEVPQQYIDKFAWIDYQPRQHYMAMVNFLDDMVGRVVAALKAKGMWDNLLLISTADASTAQAALSPHPAALTRHPPIIPLPNQPSQNGGPIYQSGAAGANNWPLRGGKMSNWNGGIRINAYASGGLVPAARRGTIEEGLFHGCDAYATFSCPGGTGNSCPVFLGNCNDPSAVWDESQGVLENVHFATPGLTAQINIDCNSETPHTVAKLLQAGGNPIAFADGQLAWQGTDLCLNAGQGPLIPPCNSGEGHAAQQIQVDLCSSASTQGWTRTVAPPLLEAAAEGAPQSSPRGWNK